MAKGESVNILKFDIYVIKLKLLNIHPQIILGLG